MAVLVAKRIIIQMQNESQWVHVRGDASLLGMVVLQWKEREGGSHQRAVHNFASVLCIFSLCGDGGCSGMKHLM